MGDEGQRTREGHPLSSVFCPLSFHTGAPPRWRLSIREGRSLLRPLGARGADGGMRAQQVAPLPLWMCAGLMSHVRAPVPTSPAADQRARALGPQVKRRLR